MLHKGGFAIMLAPTSKSLEKKKQTRTHIQNIMQHHKIQKNNDLWMHPNSKLLFSSDTEGYRP